MGMSQVCITMTKYQRKSTQRRKDLFWLMVSEVPVHGCLAGSIALVLWQAEHHGQEGRKEQSCFIKVAEKQRENWEQNILFKGTPPMTDFLQLGLASSSLHHLPRAPRLGTKPPTHGPDPTTAMGCRSYFVQDSTVSLVTTSFMFFIKFHALVHATLVFLLSLVIRTVLRSFYLIGVSV
jgi:hypothetical protein